MNILPGNLKIHQFPMRRFSMNKMFFDDQIQHNGRADDKRQNESVAAVPLWCCTTPKLATPNPVIIESLRRKMFEREIEIGTPSMSGCHVIGPVHPREPEELND